MLDIFLICNKILSNFFNDYILLIIQKFVIEDIFNIYLYN